MVDLFSRRYFRGCRKAATGSFEDRGLAMVVLDIAFIQSPSAKFATEMLLGVVARFDTDVDVDVFVW